MKKPISLLLLLVYVFPFTVLAQTSVEVQIKRVEQGLLPPVLIKGEQPWSIEERMKHWKVPGLSVAVIKDFKVDWARSYGVKDIDTKEPVTTETLFQAGSISKPVAAMVALKRVQDGKIALEENINNKLQTWKLPDNEFTAKKKVTLANLLSHTAGLTVHGFPGYAVDAKIPTVPQVLDGAEPANTAAVRVDMEPGTKFRYSGGGTTIAQLAIMDIEKKPFPEIARETVLEPLKMTNSTYSQPLPDDWRKKAASGHRGDGTLVPGKIHVYPEMAAAGLWTTPTDLAKFGIEVQLSYAGKSNKVLPKELIDKMVTPYMEQVGLGFFIDKRGDNSIYFGHDGADAGFRAMMLMHREKGHGAVIMVNSDNGQIMGEVFRGIAYAYGWNELLPAVNELISLDATKLDEYTGRFQIDSDRILTVTRNEGKLIAQPTGEPKFELWPIAEGTFIRRDQNVKYTFVKKTTAVSELQLSRPSGPGLTVPKASDTPIPFEHVTAGNIDKALEAYRQIKKDNPRDPAVSEGRLNTLGYNFLRSKKLPEAIVYFKLNAEFYPNSFNVYDSLGEAYMANGDKELAIANYKKSLELNPKNKHAAEQLKKLTAN